METQNGEEINEIANYCLNCKVKPCSKKGCPLGNDIPMFISYVKEGNLKKFHEVDKNT